MPSCHKCGSRISDQYSFCPHCRSAIKARKTDFSVPKKEKKHATAGISTTKVLLQSLETARRMKNLLYAVAAIYIVSFLTGYILVYFRVPYAVGVAETVRESVSVSPVFTPVLSALREGNLAFAIAYTFLFNLFGAFLWTTFPGIIPLGGGLVAAVVSALRGFTIGTGADRVFGASVGYTIAAIGTLILELGAYVFSAAAGINISLSAVFPRRYRVRSRRTASRMAWRDAARLYVIVVILLVLGAIWEIVGIYVTAVRT